MTCKPLIRLLQPWPRVCPGRPAPRFAPAGNGFLCEVVASVGARGLAGTVDGFIVDVAGKITRIFFKREFELLQTGAREADIADALIHEVAVQHAKPFYCAVAKLLGCGVDYLFAPAGYPYHGAAECKMLLLSVDDVDCGRARRRYVDYQALAEHIRRYRGRSFARPKPITVATSAIECFLANEWVRADGADPFPGDLDLIALENGKARLIAEFKTHNLASPIANESCANYQAEDWRRLQVLFQISGRLACKLFYVFWGPNHQEIKVQEITPNRKIVQSAMINKDANALAEFFSEHA